MGTRGWEWCPSLFFYAYSSIRCADSCPCANPLTVHCLSLPPVPVWHDSLNGAPLHSSAADTINTMAQITLTTNGQTVKLDGDVEALSAFLSGLNLNVPITQPAVTVTQQIEDKAIKFQDFLIVELERYINGGKFFVSELNRLRTKGNNYIPMGRVYREFVNKKQPGWAKRRQLLLTASAIWRYTFAGHSELRNDIVAATECTDCGEFARAMVQRMIEEKLWV